MWCWFLVSYQIVKLLDNMHGGNGAEGLEAASAVIGEAYYRVLCKASRSSGFACPVMLCIAFFTRTVLYAYILWLLCYKSLLDSNSLLDRTTGNKSKDSASIPDAVIAREFLNVHT
uniref:Uncharacterized protein n=1 Tax=Glossina austeni TaxID=7395 RepID=A0A1A9VDK1_GLOAU